MFSFNWRIDIKDLLGKHFSETPLAKNANFMNQGQSVIERSNECVGFSHKFIKEEKPDPYAILASHMYRMYEQKVPLGQPAPYFKFRYRQLDGVEFDIEFVNMLTKRNLECGRKRYAGYTFIAEEDNRTLKHYTNNGAILVGSPDNPEGEITKYLIRTLSSLVFVANGWVFFAIVNKNIPNACYIAENLKLYTWTRSFDGDWENRYTLVARNFEDLSIFLEWKKAVGYWNRLRTWLCKSRSPQVMPEPSERSQGNIEKRIVVNLGLTKNFKLDRLLLASVLAYTNALTPEEQESISVTTYFKNVSLEARDLIPIIRNEKCYNFSFLQTPPERKFCLHEPVSWQFAVSALVPVEPAIKIFDEMTLPGHCARYSTGSSILLLSNIYDNGQQIHDFATILKEKMGSDAVKDILSSWDRESKPNVVPEADE